ncbi:rod shape-determining protein RodA [Halovulum dunhuangense]|uniref:Peptidoglycan glycosyltransferase MrdB n=1 Tax=Halovulum dunhuangense TaxID=1505036 RepID=A0A849L0W3_9RHOB|nr:rod shape-determining protein RodA [Halovulum dunhuangense]NNU79900.1 rod shape-determining protein RodA [Halovulum dunhuangense]
MTFLDQSHRQLPTGAAKILHLNWAIILLLCAIASTGFLMLYSVANGSFDPWASRQMVRFAAGAVVMLIIAMIHIRFWRAMAPLAYGGSLILLVLVEFFGEVGMGAQRWIDLGFIQLQPSELMKIALVMMLALYYDWLDPDKVSRPQWLIIPLLLILAPVALVLTQPDLGTAILLAAGGGVVMFLAGVSLWYFGAAIGLGAGLVTLVMQSRGTSWQLLKDYQYRRIETFLDPSTDPLGAGYHITQSKIALGSGGLSGRGFMEGTQARLNFLPEKHTDFIFTTLAEEFGFVGSASLLIMFTLVVVFAMTSALRNRDRFGALLTAGVGATFFFYFSVNMAMVMGLIPVVGVPLPLVSYGGSAMLVLMAAFGLLQSAHVHRPR